MSLSPGAVVLAGRYRLEGRIASGGMGEVWRAVDLVLDRLVAVKLLRAEYAEHADTLARFRAEARHAAAVSHPGIAQVYDYGEAGQGQPPFLVMEHVDGQPLTQLLAGGPLAPARVLDVVAQAAAGLAAAHAAGLVHRDIKPGNLLVDRGGAVKITDFGIAHAAGSAPLTRTGTLIGTPAYLAPERLAGGTAGPASDLYSLGVVAYECLTGAPPFTGTAVEVALAHQYRLLPALPPWVPGQVAALVAELTARDPAQRPASASDVVAGARLLQDAVSGTAAYPNPLPGPPGTPAVAGGAETGTAVLPSTLSGLPDEVPGRVLTASAADAGGYGRVGPVARLRDALRTGPGRRAAVLAAAAAAIVAGLGGWLLAGVAGALPPRHGPAATSQAVTATARHKIEVNEAALVGQPVGAVAERLRQLGLQVRVSWVPSGHEAPGTVLSVQPAGRVPAGTTVVVAAAALPPGNDHRHGGDGHGHGGGGHGGD